MTQRRDYVQTQEEISFQPMMDAPVQVSSSIGASALPDVSVRLTAPERGSGDTTSPRSRLCELLQNEVNSLKPLFLPPLFDGVGDVYLFLERFQGVRDVNRWDELTAMLHLKSCLSGDATDCTTGTTLNRIEQNLCIKYGMSHQVARQKIRSLTLTKEQSLFSLGVRTERLVKLAYPGASEDFLQELSLHAFQQAIGHTEMSKYFHERKPTSVLEAVSMAMELLEIMAPEASSTREGLRVLTSLSDLPSRTQSTLTNPTKKKRPRKQGPRTGCWICGGAHYQCDCPRKIASKRRRRRRPAPSKHQVNSNVGPSALPSPSHETEPVSTTALSVIVGASPCETEPRELCVETLRPIHADPTAPTLADISLCHPVAAQSTPLAELAAVADVKLQPNGADETTDHATQKQVMETDDGQRRRKTRLVSDILRDFRKQIAPSSAPSTPSDPSLPWAPNPENVGSSACMNSDLPHAFSGDGYDDGSGLSTDEDYGSGTTQTDNVLTDPAESPSCDGDDDACDLSTDEAYGSGTDQTDTVLTEPAKSPLCEIPSESGPRLVNLWRRYNVALVDYPLPAWTPQSRLRLAHQPTMTVATTTAKTTDC